jgi:hypothetical protein
MDAQGTENGKSFSYMSRKEYHDAAESAGYKAGYKEYQEHQGYKEYLDTSEKNVKSITLRNTAGSAEREREREREFVRPETVKSFTFIQDAAESPGESGKVIPVLGL